jgi:hypothetical protein
VPKQLILNVIFSDNFIRNQQVRGSNPRVGFNFNKLQTIKNYHIPTNAYMLPTSTGYFTDPFANSSVLSTLPLLDPKKYEMTAPKPAAREPKRVKITPLAS